MDKPDTTPIIEENLRNRFLDQGTKLSLDFTAAVSRFGDQSRPADIPTVLKELERVSDDIRQFLDCAIRVLRRRNERAAVQMKRTETIVLPQEEVGGY